MTHREEGQSTNQRARRHQLRRGGGVQAGVPGTLFVGRVATLEREEDVSERGGWRFQIFRAHPTGRDRLAVDVRLPMISLGWPEPVLIPRLPASCLQLLRWLSGRKNRQDSGLTCPGRLADLAPVFAAVRRQRLGCSDVELSFGWGFTGWE
jgi:hypothetical protein